MTSALEFSKIKYEKKKRKKPWINLKNPRLYIVTLTRQVSRIPYAYICMYVNAVANSLMVTDKRTT